MGPLSAHPRILYLPVDPARLRAQLDGMALRLADARPLRDDVSTDEISPLPVMVNFDDALGRYPYVGLETGGERPVDVDAIRTAGIEVVVAGRRYGKGSSREHSVVAERAAGVRLVIAESFERIYRQNADNVGLFTSTEFGLLEALERGESITLDALLAGRDALAAAILRRGGLLRYGRAVLVLQVDGDAGTAVLRAPAFEESAAPRTLFQKILDEAFGPQIALCDPRSIVTFEDHLSYVHRSPVHVEGGLVMQVRGLSTAHRRFAARHGLTEHGYQADLPAGDARNHGSQGISHAMMTEQYALPGQVVVGTDSHTPHSGALGCVAFGVGTTDMANAFVTGATRITVPAVLRVEFDGRLPAGVMAKDLVLHLLALPAIRAGVGVGKVFEFGGAVVRALPTDERATLTNMTAELGGFTGIVEPDAETVRFIRERRGVDVILESWMRSDDGAAYADVIRIDCGVLTPMVARPGDPGNGVPLSCVRERVKVDIAYGGSCTAGKREDFDQYHAVLAWAAANGLRVPADVALYLQFGTVAVRDYCVAQGYLAAFEAVGAEILQPACGACANCGPGSSTASDQVTVSAVNRNFPGRSGPGQVWLASPPTVAASAIAGELVSFDELRRRHEDATPHVTHGAAS